MGSVVSVTPRQRYFRDPLNRWLCWAQTRSGCSGEDRTSCPDQSSLRFLGRTTCGLATVPAASRLESGTKKHKVSKTLFPFPRKKAVKDTCSFVPLIFNVWFPYFLNTDRWTKCRLLLKIICAFNNVYWTPRTTFYQYKLGTFEDIIRSTDPTSPFCVHFIHVF